MVTLLDLLTDYIHKDDKKIFSQSEAFEVFVFASLKVLLFCSDSCIEKTGNFISTFVAVSFGAHFGQNFEAACIKKEDKVCNPKVLYEIVHFESFQIVVMVKACPIEYAK